MYLRGGLSLHPKESFVKNIGFDGTGAHCGKSNVFNVELKNDFDIKFTTKIEEDLEARKRLEEFFRKIRPPFYKRISIKILKSIGLYEVAKQIYRKQKRKSEK